MRTRCLMKSSEPLSKFTESWARECWNLYTKRLLSSSWKPLNVVRQAEVEVFYKNQRLNNKLRLDMLVDGIVIVEIKSIEKILPVHEAQLLTYLRLAEKKLGLLINFNTVVLRNSIKRIVNNL